MTPTEYNKHIEYIKRKELLDSLEVGGIDHPRERKPLTRKQKATRYKKNRQQRRSRRANR